MKVNLILGPRSEEARKDVYRYLLKLRNKQLSEGA